ncbi:MAG: hypothetical protein AB7W59_04695 [Acidimicrobiia bacterium]
MALAADPAAGVDRAAMAEAAPAAAPAATAPASRPGVQTRPPRPSRPPRSIDHAGGSRAAVGRLVVAATSLTSFFGIGAAIALPQMQHALAERSAQQQQQVAARAAPAAAPAPIRVVVRRIPAGTQPAGTLPDGTGAVVADPTTVDPTAVDPTAVDPTAVAGEGQPAVADASQAADAVEWTESEPAATVEADRAAPAEPEATTVVSNASQ